MDEENRAIDAIKIEMLIEMPVESPQAFLDRLADPCIKKILVEFLSQAFPDIDTKSENFCPITISSWKVTKKRVVYASCGTILALDEDFF
jgi:hypothetical protein